MGGVIQVPFREGNQFLGEGGVQDIFYGVVRPLSRILPRFDGRARAVLTDSTSRLHPRSPPSRAARAHSPHRRPPRQPRQDGRGLDRAAPAEAPHRAQGAHQEHPAGHGQARRVGRQGARDVDQDDHRPRAEHHDAQEHAHGRPRQGGPVVHQLARRAPAPEAGPRGERAAEEHHHHAAELGALRGGRRPCNPDGVADL
mgnify:CR=1 FL=1